MIGCDKYEELIALYVEGDLNDREIRSVESHIAACANCLHFVEEMRESQSALKSFGKADLDESLFINLRSSVMEKIAVEPVQESFWNRFFNPRIWKLAFTSVLIATCLISASIYWLFSSRIDNQTTVEKIAPKNQIEPDNRKKDVEIVKDTVLEKKNNPVKKRNKTVKIESRTLEDVATVLPEVSRSTFIIGSDAIDLTEANYIENETSLVPDNNSKMKVEFQTSDPNVCIIWFFNKDTGNKDESTTS